MKIKKGDTVKVISGNYRGKTGKVLKVMPKRDRAIVEGINFIKRHTRPSQSIPQGGIIEREASIHISNLMLVVNNTPTRVGYTQLEDGKKVRFAKKIGETVNE
ncbi:MAG: 50S ribosomal protein L24 [Fidelibacterota bacterium]|nr:MAG: 50S ribosomal protein L24 [Candidatus Neomarinimicrobiota bacterium]